MGTYHGRVDDEVFHVRIVCKMLMHPFPDTLLAPAGKPLVYAVPLAVLGWQKPPGTSTASYPKDGFDEAATFGLLSSVDIRALIKELIYL